MRIYSQADFQQHVTLGATPESVAIEFKKDLHGFGSKDPAVKTQGAIELARDIATFTNSSGGCLVIGVSEDSVGIAKAIHPFQDAAGRVAWIEQALINYTVPSTFSHTVDRIALPAGEIIAVNIEPSITLVYVYHDQQIEVHVRTSHGKRRLNPNEMEQRIMDRSRAIRIQLAEIATPERMQRAISLSPGFYEWNQARGVYMPTNPVTMLRAVDEYQLELLLPDLSNRCVTVPLAYVETCWRTADGYIGLGLYMRLVLNGPAPVRFEPF